LFALPIYQQQGEEWDEHLAFCVKQTADCDFAEGAYRDAEVRYKKAIHLYAVAGQEKSETVIVCLFGLGRTYRSMKELDAAKRVLQEAVQRIESSESKPLNRGAIHAELANVLRQKGAVSAAEEAFERAHRESVEARTSAHPEVARILEDYADFLRATNRPGPAAKLRAQAAEIRTKLLVDR
jgi:tetratricopeptide (TPR) repeat protein